MLDTLKIVRKDNGIRDQVKTIVPDGNLSACLTCGACASGCPATGINNTDPRKFIRMAVFGMDEEIERNPWIWACTMCNQCYDLCPMSINIPQLITYLRFQWPEQERPKGISGACGHHVRSEKEAKDGPLEDF